jgi:transcriptional regulator with XRE-family HTH domain
MKQKNKTLGEILADCRKIKKMSQKKLAAELAVSVDDIKKVETTDSPNSKLVKKIIKYFDIPLSFIAYSMLTTDDMKPGKKKYFEKAQPVIENLLYILLGMEKPTNEVNPDLKSISEN